MKNKFSFLLSCVFIAAGVHSANAQVYSSQYTVSGSTVTGSGTSNSAYFTGAASTEYNVTVDTGANLNSPGNTDQIQLDKGTVTVQSGATIASTGSSDSVHFTGTGGTGTLNNIGTINSSGSTYNIEFDGNGIVNNSGTIGASSTATIAITGSGSASVTNTGTIYEGVNDDAISTGNSGAAAGTQGPVYILNDTTGTLTSNGEIGFAKGVDVWNSPDATTINNGTISSNGGSNSVGIRYVGDTSGSILNTGTIDTYNGGFYGNEAFVLTGSQDIILTNSGTVTVVANTEAYGLQANSANDITVNNSGLFNITTTAGASYDAFGLEIGSTSNTYTINNTGTIEAYGAGTTASSGIYAYAGSTGVSITNSGTITGTDYGVYLGGNGSGVTTTTGGIITGGTDAIALAGTNDTVTIRGQSHITGTIQGNVTTPGTPLAGDTLTLYLNNLTSSDLAAFRAEIATAGTGLGSFTIGSDTYSWDSFSSVTVGMNLIPLMPSSAGAANDVRAAAALDAGGGNTELAAIQNNLSNATTVQTQTDILEATTPTVDMSAPAAAANVTDNSFDLVTMRLGSLQDDSVTMTGLSAGDNGRGLGVWGQGFGQHTYEGARDGVAGYNANTFGGAVGFDTRNLSDKAIVGASFSYGRTNASSRNANDTRTDTDSYQLTLYGTYDIEPRTYIEGMGGYSWNRTGATRHDVGGIAGLDAEGDFHASQFSGQVEAGHRWDVYNTVLTPHVLASGITYNPQSYTETGAGGADLHVDGRTLNLVQLGAGLSAGWRLKTAQGLVIKPQLDAGYRYAVVNDPVEDTALFTGGGTAFAAKGPDPARSSFDLGGSVAVKATANWTLSASYNLELKADYVANSGLIRVGYKF